MKQGMKFLFAFILIISASKALYAQEEYFRVYQFETPYRGHLELTNWSTVVGESSEDSYDHYGKNYSRDGLFATSLEAEYGLTDHFVIAGYADFDDPQNGHFNYARSRIEVRYRFGERFDHWVNTMAYVEYYFPNHTYSNSQELEARLILDKDLGDVRIAVNPMISKYVNGDEDQSWQPSVSAGVYYRRGKTVQPGIEYYENFHEQSASLFPVIDINIGSSIIWNLGAGFGIHDPADKLTFKSIFQVDLQAIRPSRFMRRKFTQSELTM